MGGKTRNVAGLRPHGPQRPWHGFLPLLEKSVEDLRGMMGGEGAVGIKKHEHILCLKIY